MKLPLTLLMFLLLKCVSERTETDDRLTFTNSSNTILYGAISQDLLENSADIVDYSVPKTAKTEFVDGSENKSFRGEGINYWPNFVKNSKTKSVNVFVIENKTYFQNDWESLCKKKLYTKAIFTLEQLEAVNWHINLDSIKKHNKPFRSLNY